MTDETKKLLTDLKAIQKQSTALVKLMTGFERLSADPVNHAFELDQELSRIKKAVEGLGPTSISPFLNAWIDRCTPEVSIWKEQFRHEFGRRLQEQLMNIGLTLGGRYPDLKVSFYTIHIDFSRGTAALLFGHDPLQEKIPLSPEKISKAVEGVNRSLNRSFEPVKFIKLLRKAYDRCCRLLGVPSGEKVPVVDVLHQLIFLIQTPQFLADPTKDHFRGYGRSHFGYDLYRLRLSDTKTGDNKMVGLSTATFDTTRKRENFIWVPDNETGDGTTYSLVCFK